MTVLFPEITHESTMQPTMQPMPQSTHGVAGLVAWPFDGRAGRSICRDARLAGREGKREEKGGRLRRRIEVIPHSHPS